VKAHAQLVVERDRLRVLACEPPLALRPCPDGVYLVASAAGPIGGDDIALDVVVGDDAELVARSAAASLALPGPDGSQSRVSLDACVGRHARLTWRPEPLIAAAGCNHVTDMSIRLDPTASVCWREELVLGRADEEPGACALRMRVDRGEVPLLRHDLVVGAARPPHAAAAMLGTARVVGTLIIVGDRVPATAPPPTRRPDLEVSVMPLEAGGVLVTALGRDARGVRAALDDAEQRFS
jgi:urease accessory protein